MIIKNNNKIIKTANTGKKRLNVFWKTLLVIFIFIVGIAIGVLLNQNRIIKSLSTVKEDLLYFFGGEMMTDIKNYFQARQAKPEVLLIDIKQKNYDKLAYNRSIALERGLLLPDCRDDVPAVITWRGEKYKVKMRLKGDMPDHWADPDKWSFRITVNGDKAIMGMQNFSIQSPETRGSLNEWLYHKFLRYNELIALRYDFVTVKLNGKDLGVYALEEFFEKRLIENNSRREGPILRFDESLYMPLLLIKPTNIADIPSFYKEGFTVAQIDAFQTNKILNDSAYYQRFTTAKNLLEAFRMGKLKTSDVFDISQLALFFAINDLFGEWGFGGHHSIEYRNLRFYFNPFTEKIEPIGYDNGYIWYTSQNGLQVENPENYEWIDLFFKDPEFMNQYIIALNKISDKSYLDKFFKTISSEMKDKLAILYMDSPKYRFYGKEILYENQKYIKTVLNYPSVLNAHFYKIDENKLVLKIGNRQWMPLKITELWYKDSLKLNPAENVIIPSKKTHQLMQYVDVTFNIPSGLNLNLSNIGNLTVKCMSNPLKKEFSSPVIPWDYYDWQGQNPQYELAPSDLSNFDFLIVNEKDKSITVKQGKHILRQNLVIPQGYTFFVNEGTTIDIQNKSNVISFSPVKFIGSIDKPIYVISSDSTGQGIAVLTPHAKSHFEYVYFDNLSNHNQGSWILTGSVTFYEADATMKYCYFSNNRAGDDAVNFVRCNFWVDNCVFTNACADALDGDFVKGIITNCYFIRPGNDGLDFSGSSLLIRNVTVEKPGDKGISLGEVSEADAKDIKIIGGEIAIAAKDKAKLNIDNLTVTDVKLAFAVYQKKPEFGEGSVVVKNFVSKNVETLYLLEKGSYLSINTNIIKPNRDDVKDLLYGIEYGKASNR